MIDNIHLIKPFVVSIWNQYTESLSFHIQILQRSKDGHDSSTRLVTEWFIGSEQRFDFLLPAMKTLCQEYNARCYINLNPKLDSAITWKMLEMLPQRLKSESYSPFSITSSAHDSTSGFGIKSWIIDVDDPFVNEKKLIDDINRCRSSFDQKVIMKLPTKNGFHLITTPFDLSQLELPVGVEVKKNNSTILIA